MRLTVEQIKTCLRGCERIDTSSGAMWMDRIGPAGRQYYDATPGSKLRARCPAGVVLEMLTDAKAIDFSLSLNGGARKYAAVDAVVEDAMVASISTVEVTGDFKGKLVLPPCDGVRRVQLYLPHSADVSVVSIDLVDATTVVPPPRRRVWLMLGDSITQGMDAIRPSLTYATVAARMMKMDLYNYAIGGAVFARESIPEPPVADPALITVAYGTNDFSIGRDVEAAREYLMQVKNLYPAIPIIVLMPLWRVKGDADGWINPAGISMAEYRRGLVKILDDLNLKRIDPEMLFPAIESMHVDGLHPGDEGHLLLGMNVATHLMRIWDEWANE